jgi:MHS family proline/betaine transporter-like MFS transporter
MEQKTPPPSTSGYSKKDQRVVIVAVTLGNVLEWYEIFLYVYWAPIISKLFFDSGSDFKNLINTFWVFGLGLLARPVGGIFFGRLGDIIGRKKVLIISVLLMTIPTFVTGLLPTHAQIGFIAPWLLAAMRLIQSFPAGAELPGACCYLYESSRFSDRKYLTSWGAVGFQTGILVSTLECLFLEHFLTYEQLVAWGWRLSFWLGGLIGLVGLWMRSKLHESPLFHEMTEHLKSPKDPILDMFRHKKGIAQGFFFSLLCSSGFYLFTVNFPIYFGDLFGLKYTDNLLILVVLLILITAPLPLFGKIAEKYDYKKMLIYSTGGMIMLLYPLYFGIVRSNAYLSVAALILFCLLYSCMTSLLPYIFCNLFPTRSRFTCVATSFNLADALIGGFTPVMTLYLLELTGDSGSFCWILLFFGVLSLGSFMLIKERNHA